MVELSRRGQRLLGGVIVLLLFGGMTMAYLRQGPAVVTADVALEQFRATPGAPDAASEQPPAGATDAGVASIAPTAAPSATPSAASVPPGEQVGAPAPTASQPSGPMAPPPPAEGVYAYRTTGYEEVEAFGGARHDYPAETYMTVRRKGCGVMLRWQPLKERWDESDHCSQGPAITIDRFSMYHEFFQQGEEQPYACDPGSHVYRAGQPAGATWKVRCSSPEFGAIDMTTKVVGVETVQVGSESRRAVRMHYDAKITGYSEGTQVQERWIDEATGLMLRITTQVTVSTQTPLGRTPYHERYRIDLLSMQPRT
jgi:hypothetical protein